MDWPYEIAERDHEIQNPTSAEKILLLGSYLRLTAESRVLESPAARAARRASSPPRTGAGSPASRSGRNSPTPPASASLQRAWTSW
jgi:hypothetical protein